MMKAYCWPGCLTIMYDAKKIGLIQSADLEINEEYSIWIKASNKSNCYLLDENLAKYRRHSQSLSNRSYFNLIKWHYLLFRKSENKNIITSILLTINNIFFGIIKKIIYRRNY